ncbi:MAG: hypothetical protein PUA96_07370 [Bacteroidales bacterium]|nr:hypothetical protein [Bacteroidales bacterium]
MVIDGKAAKSVIPGSTWNLLDLDDTVAVHSNAEMPVLGLRAMLELENDIDIIQSLQARPDCPSSA